KLVLESAMFYIINNGEYMIDKTPYQLRWVLKKNPAFELSKSVKLTNKIQRVVLILTVIISITSVTVAYLNYKKKSEVKIYQIQGAEKKDTILIDMKPPK